MSALHNVDAAARCQRFNIGTSNLSGLNQSGNFESLFRGLREFIFDLVADEAEIRLLFEEKGRLADASEILFSSKYWSVAFDLYFSDSLLNAMFGPEATQHAEEWRIFQSRIADLEKGTSYPLGEDRFEIDHGADYFAFFTRLGQLHYYVVLDGERVVAVAAAILRRVPPASREKPKKVWYLCDLKVHPEYQGRYLPVSIFVHAFPKLYPHCSRRYAVSMDADSERPNRVARMLKSFPLAPMAIATRLGIISLDAKQIQEVAPVLQEHFGCVSYLSLAGKKDIILQSTRSDVTVTCLVRSVCRAGVHRAA